MKKIKLALCLIILCLEQIHAQLLIKNSTTEDVTVCIGWYEEGGNGFTTKGWFTIKPNETIKPGLTFTSLKDRFYYYAYSKASVWEDKYRMLTSKQAFNITNADKESVKTSNLKYEWKNFRQADVSFGLLEEKTYTLNLTSNKKIETMNKNSSTYIANSGTTIKIEGVIGNETIKFTIVGANDGKCTNSQISSTAEIHRMNMNGAGSDYSGPEFWYEYSDETSCSINITPDLKNNTIEVSAENCKSWQDGTCKSWKGIYKKK